MCNHNSFFVPKGALTALDVERVTSASFTSNSHGDGAWINGVSAKSAGKLDYSAFSEAFKNAEVVLTHQRFATNGAATAANTHPFVLGDWVFAHNGIYYGSKVPTGESDSLAFFTELYARLNTGTPVLDAVKETLDDFSGSGSCLLFNRKLNTGWYWRGSGSTISIFEFRNGIYVATAGENAALLDGVTSEYEVKHEMLYSIERTKDGWGLFEVGSVRVAAKWSYYQDGRFVNGSYGFDYEGSGGSIRKTIKANGKPTRAERKRAAREAKRAARLAASDAARVKRDAANADSVVKRKYSVEEWGKMSHAEQSRVLTRGRIARAARARTLGGARVERVALDKLWKPDEDEDEDAGVFNGGSGVREAYEDFIGVA